MKGINLVQKEFEVLKASEKWKNVSQREIEWMQLNIDAQWYYFKGILVFLFFVAVLLNLLFQYTL